MRPNEAGGVRAVKSRGIIIPAGVLGIASLGVGLVAGECF